MIVSFSGIAQSGKDTAAKALLEKGFVKMSFAGPLKELAAKFFGLNLELIERLKDQRFRSPYILDADGQDRLIGLLQECAANANITIDQYQLNALQGFSQGVELHSIRDFLQFVGTDLGRNIINTDIWVKSALSSVPRDKDVVFTDVRFPNELEAVDLAGGISFFVQGRGGLSHFGNHESESAVIVSDFPNHRVLNNLGTIAELHNNVLEALHLRTL